MPRFFVSICTALLVTALAGLALADSAPGEQGLPGLEVDPFDNPEAFVELLARMRDEGSTEGPVVSDAPEDAARKTQSPQAPQDAASDGTGTAAQDTAARADEPASASQATTETAGPDRDDDGQAEAVAQDEASGADSEPRAAEDAPAGESAEEPAEQPETAPVAPPKKLDPHMTQLRDRVRQTLREHAAQDYTVYSSTVTDVMHYCLAFGPKAGVRIANSPRPVSGIGSLCYNYAFRGYRPLTVIDDRPAARVGYGLQAYPSQLLALLAQSRVKPEYPIRVGKFQGTVADLVEQEQLDCHAETDMGLKLVGLSYYLGTGEEWNSRDGQIWSIDRMIRTEMDKPFVEAACGGLHRLMGLSYAVKRRVKDDLPVDGGYQRAQKYLLAFHDHALKLQNKDGSWHPEFFRVKGVSRDTAGTLRSTGMIVEWLAYSLPEAKLEDPRMVRSVDYLTNLLGSRRYSVDAPELPAREIAAAMHAAHALAIYDQRVFKPADPPPKAEEVAEKTSDTDSR